MAREAGLVAWLPNSNFSDGIWWIEAHEVGSELEAFAALVASAERNRCVARADISLLGADITLRNCVLKAINIKGAV